MLERRDPAAIDLTCRLSQHLTLKRPIVSANMDTVTRAEMAIAVAEEGGIGIIDRGFRSGDIEPQVREVERVKRRQHGTIVDPYTIGPGATARQAMETMRRTGVGTLVVVDDGRKLVGLLTTRDLRFVEANGATTVAERMTPPSGWSCAKASSMPAAPKRRCAPTRSRSCRWSTRPGS